MTFNELRNLYLDNFTIVLESKDLSNRLALYSLLGYVVYQTKLKTPDVDFYKVTRKFGDLAGLGDKDINAIAITAEGLCDGCTEFTTFGLKGKQIGQKIVEIMKNILPF